MNLGDISNIYQENLNSFFRNEKVIELIYKEQFGSEKYDENKELYHENFKNIIDNTLFVPYIRLEDLDRILKQLRLSNGDNYVKTNFAKELNLSIRLNAEKNNIVKKYSSFMLEDMKQLFPNKTEDEYSKILKHCSNKNFDENAEFIENELFKDTKGIFTKFKKAKVEKIVEKYRKLTADKIAMETSSFYKHLSDVPEGKNYTDILEGMSSGGQFVVQKIGKNTDKNIRYIFLPVLKYHSKEEYLKNALHEVMHISKEQISNRHYKSGFLNRDIPKSPNSSTLTIKSYFFNNLWQTLRWSKIAKKNNLPSQNELYKVFNGSISSEEVIHHWQTREVLSEIVKSNLIEKLDFPYSNKSNEITIHQYELFDKTTKNFVLHFKNDIQKVNNGELSLRKFKRKVGKNNFDLFAQAANICVKDNNIVNTPLMSFSNLTSDSASNIFPDNSKYNKIGNNLVEKMIDTSSRRSKFLEKTREIATMDILSTGKTLETKLQNKQTDIINGPTR